MPSCRTTAAGARHRTACNASRRAWWSSASSPICRPRPPESRVGLDPHRVDAIGIGDRLAALDLVDVVHALDHAAPDRVLAVEPGRVGKADEELAVAGIRILRPRHRDGAAL